jgi:hypothetical protein
MVFIVTSLPPTIVQSGFQGPQGPPGLVGPSTMVTPATALGGNRVVTGIATYADNTDITTLGNAIGVTQTSTLANTPVTLTTSGELDGFSNLVPNGSVYLSTLGTVTQILPSVGYIQKIGVAISTTKILLNFNPPLVQI